MINLFLKNNQSFSTTALEAIQYVKINKKLILTKFANPNIYPPHDKPFTIFMAGAPGAGKTEVSKSFIKNLVKKQGEDPIVSIDIDEIRKMLPQYNGKNSSEIQAAATIGVEKLFDFVQKNSQNAVIDSTLASYDKAKNDIQRAIHRNRSIGIFYIYQEPQQAWEFTKKREIMEGRYVPKEVFIESFIKSKINAQQLKNEFGDQIELHLIVKNIDHSVKKAKFNISHIDGYLEKMYTIGQLQELIK